MASGTRKIRLHFEERVGTLRNAAQIVFGGDGSLYLFPYAANGDYWYGSQTIPAGEQQSEVKFREQIAAESRPKLSIHGSGSVHIYANGQPKAGPLTIPRLRDLRGEHIASVQFDHVKLMPIHRGATKTTGEKIDIAFGVPSEESAGRIAIYANGERNLFLTEYVHFAVQSHLTSDGEPFWVGFTGLGDDPLGNGEEGGVSVLAGFETRKRPEEAQEFLFLRGH